jgi:hypothetical protein
MKFYVASRVKHAEMWKGLRAKNYPIISTWIDEAGENETCDFAELWERITNEIWKSEGLILYAENEDFPLKGALVEVGIAIAFNKPVFVVLPGVQLEGRTMRPVGSWLKHDLVTKCDHLDMAFTLAQESEI